MMQKSTILTVGSMAFDSIQTPAGKAEQVLGGSVNYFSLAAAFYTPVQIVGVVGNDFPKSHLSALNARGIDTRGVQVIADGKTFHWVGEYDGNMSEAKTLSTQLNVFEHFSPKLSAAHLECPVVFLANIDPTIQLSVLDQVRSSRLIACDTMNFWIGGKLAELKKVLARVDILSINEGEARLLSGQKNLLRAAETIREMGPSVLVVKQGEYGAAVFTPKGIFMVPAFPLPQVVDPTGAGDSFAGAMIGYLAASGLDRDLAKTQPEAFDATIRQAAIVGCVMASFTVEDFSIHRLMRLERPELTLRQNALLAMMRVPSGSL